MYSRLADLKYRHWLYTIFSALLLSGCGKAFETHHLLNTIDFASYRGRTWVALNVSKHYQRIRPNGESYDSVIHYPRDTTLHVYLATNWSLEIPPKLLPILELTPPCKWDYNQKDYNIIFSSVGSTDTFSIGLWDQGDYKLGTQPFLELSTYISEPVPAGTASKWKRVDIDLELVGEGKL